MKSKIMLILSFFILSILNYGIYEKEEIKNNGETILLELAPVDPRSLMQGDYMRLRYAIERTAPSTKIQHTAKRGFIVIEPDKNNIAKFVRFHSGESLQEKEKLLKFHYKYGIKIVPDSFLFQEGHAKYYEDAKYGVFKFDKNGNKLLVGLAGTDKKIISIME